jgi:hypothetical protein
MDGNVLLNTRDNTSFCGMIVPTNSDVDRWRRVRVEGRRRGCGGGVRSTRFGCRSFCVSRDLSQIIVDWD